MEKGERSDEMKKICIFPSDPINAYYEKGEIKERYFNPCGFFDEVHIISLCEEDIEENKVQIIAGDAKLKVYPMGKFSLLNFFSYRNKVLKLIKEIKPDVIRAYNPLIQGYYAVYCGKDINIPTAVSIHGDYSILHNIMVLGLKFWFLKSIMSRLLIEPPVLRNATKVICAYQFLVQYAKKRGAKDIEVIYNRVDTTRFNKNNNVIRTDSPTIICVGNQIKGKNPENLIKAVKPLNVNLLLIGDGPLHPYLVKLVNNLGIENKVKFIKFVPHSEIHEYYASADIFAIPIEYGGVCIPVIEAMASSLPVVVPKPRWEDSPELVGGIAIVVENTPEAFRKAFKKLISNPELRKELGEKGRKRALEIDGKIMEEKEMKLYKELVS